MSIMLKNKVRRFGVAALAVAAAGAMALGGATAANAASGELNQGVSHVTLTPLDAVNFDAVGTTGTITFSMADGTSPDKTNYSLSVGDTSAYSFALQPGFRYLGFAPVCPAALYAFATTTCERSADQKTFTVTSVVNTPVTNSTVGIPAGISEYKWIVMRTDEPISGNGVASFTEWHDPANPGNSIGSASTTTPIIIGATGELNQGVTDATLTPLDGAVNFDTVGTTGTLTFSMADGTTPDKTNYSLNVGDTSAYSFALPPGFRYQGFAPVCPAGLYAFATTTCERSADQKTFTVTSVVNTLVTNNTVGIPEGIAPNKWIVVRLDEPMSGNGVATFTEWHDPINPSNSIASASPTTPITITEVPANETPLLAGGLLAFAGLAGAGTIVGIRRHKKNAA